MIYAKKAYCNKWGKKFGARRVVGLTYQEKTAIRDGKEVRLRDCPPYLGETDRIIVEIKNRFYTRMP